MSGVTRILEAAQQGDPTAADQLLSLVYKELRRLGEGVGQWYCRILACDEPVVAAVEPWLWCGAQFEYADERRAGADRD